MLVLKMPLASFCAALVCPEVSFKFMGQIFEDAHVVSSII